VQEVSRRASAFFGTEEARYVISGYLSDTFLLQALQEDYDRIFFDTASHYSILDALALTGKPATAFLHCDPDDLTRQLNEEFAARWASALDQ